MKDVVVCDKLWLADKQAITQRFPNGETHSVYRVSCTEYIGVGGDRGLTKLATHYAQTMHSRLKLKIYPGGRHEMFNETNRDEFSKDLTSWAKLNVQGRGGNQVGKLNSDV